MANFFKKIRNKFSNLTKKRLENTNKYKATNLVLMLAFPVFLTVMVEIIQMKSPAKFIVFLFERPSVILFSVLLVSIIYYAIAFLASKVYISTFIMTIIFGTLSISELFKFNTSGNHLILTDVTLAKNLNNLTKFAYIKITPQLVIMVLILFTYVGLVYYFNPVIKMQIKKRVAASTACILSVLCLMFSPAIAKPVYAVFNIDATQSENAIVLNEKFDNNNFVAFLAQTTTEFISKKIKKPEGYSQQAIKQILDQDVINNKFSKKPNVVVVMSEAFADFREFKNLNIDSNVYDAFDRISSKGYLGKTAVPAFASFTVKTEFELLFGLPVRSLNDPNMPTKLLKDREQKTIPAHYKSLGYNTNYIHTFARSFYGRGRRFANFGFDNMYFDDNMIEPLENYKTYISDKVIFNQIEGMIEDTDEPVFVHTTTMQNHQPYESTDPSESQLDYYLDGIENMLDNLEVFLKNIEESGEPTIVLFTGDHLPCFKGEDSIYNKLGITGSEAGNLYAQNYFIWDNFGLDYSKAPKDIVSSFYLPYVVMDLIDAPKNQVSQKIYDKINKTPVYTSMYDNTVKRDEEMDMITYDIILGEKYVEGDNNEGSKD